MANDSSSATSIAIRFLERAVEAERSDMTQIKLNKLVSLTQSLSEYSLNERAFVEPVIALDHGPAVAVLLERYKSNGAKPIADPPRTNPQRLDDVTELLIDEVWEVAGRIAPGGLWTLTHQVGPWDAFHAKGNGTEIPPKTLGDAWPDYVALADQLTQYRSPRPTAVIGRGQAGFANQLDQEKAVANFRPSRLRAGG